MIVMITKINEPFIKGILPKVKFTESTTNTSTFNVTTKTFEGLLKQVRAHGINPYSLLSW